VRARVAWLAWAAIVAAVAAAAVLGSEGEVATFAAFLLYVLAFATVGALVASHRSTNPLGWLMLVAALAYAVAGLATAYLESRGAGARGVPLAAWVSSWAWEVGVVVPAVFLLLLFPTGRLPSRRWRPLPWLAGTGLALHLAERTLSPGRLDAPHPVENPVALPGAEALLEVAGVAGALLLVASALGAVASLVVRFRQAPVREREQLKWLVLAGATIAMGGAGAILIEVVAGDAGVEVSNLLITLSVSAVPITMGIAILRHRLFDIDVVLNRTLVYGALTALLAGAYLATVLLLGLALADSDVAVAGATLAVAALVRPARAHIQGLVDRRFYRRRYDAQRTLDAFAARLRDEVDLDALGRDLRAVAHETLQPTSVSLWLR